MKKNITIQQIIFFNVVCLLGALLISFIAYLNYKVITPPDDLSTILDNQVLTQMKDIIIGQVYLIHKSQKFHLLSSLFAVVFALCNTSLLIAYLKQAKKTEQQNLGDSR